MLFEKTAKSENNKLNDFLTTSNYQKNKTHNIMVKK